MGLLLVKIKVKYITLDLMNIGQALYRCFENKKTALNKIEVLQLEHQKGGSLLLKSTVTLFVGVYLK